MNVIKPCTLEPTIPGALSPESGWVDAALCPVCHEPRTGLPAMLMIGHCMTINGEELCLDCTKDQLMHSELHVHASS